MPPPTNPGRPPEKGLPPGQAKKDGAPPPSPPASPPPNIGTYQGEARTDGGQSAARVETGAVIVAETPAFYEDPVVWARRRANFLLSQMFAQHRRGR